VPDLPEGERQGDFERRLLGGMPASVVVCGPDLLVRYATPPTRGLLGREPAGADLTTIATAAGREPFVAFLRRLAGADAGSTGTCEMRIAAEGYERVLVVSGVNRLAEPGLDGLVLQLVDVTALHRRIDEIEEHGRRDALTGLANRLVAGDRLHEVWRTGRRSSVAVLDLDHFKQINDAHGHLAGDTVLVTISRRLEQVLALEPDATVARYGGEEFLLLLPGASVERAKQVCEALIETLSAPISVDGAELSVSATFGVTTIGSSLSRTLAQADTAMYVGKQRGRGCVVVYHPSLSMPQLAQVELVDRLSTQNEALARESRTDPLTGLLNRRSFDEQLPLVHAAARAGRQRYAVVFVDLDFFGAINKASGQDEGDATLRGAARALHAGTRAGDHVYRIGGEELVALLQHVGPGDGAAVAERMRSMLEQAGLPHPAHPRSTWVTASIGVAEFDPDSPVDPAELVTAADAAMRQAKRAGGDRVALAS
jgi:diguanylate cyclase (GGDEF)-like protein